VCGVVIQVVFVSVMTNLIDRIKPTQNSSCVRECLWVQALLSRKSSQSSLSELHITTRIPLRKKTCSLTATIAQIIPENHKLSTKSQRLTNKDGNASRRHTVADNRTRSEDLLAGRRPKREEHPPSDQGGGLTGGDTSDTATLTYA
jgi:hypothetical protein